MMIGTLRSSVNKACSRPANHLTILRMSERQSRGGKTMTFLEPEAESRFDTAMVVGIASVLVLSGAFLGLMVGLLV
jgi:hypothetical protein